MTPWELGAARARAGRDLPDEVQLVRDWGLTALEAGLFALGYLEVKCGPFPIDSRLTIERAYALASSRLDQP